MRRGHCCQGCIEEEIRLARSDFYELDFEELKDLDICILEAILSSPALRLKNEDSLLEFICKVECESPILVRQVFSEYLRSETISVFVDFLSPSNPDPLIWSSLYRRLLLPASHQRNQVEIRMKATNSLDGIIWHLTKKHRGNVQEKGIVTITSKSVDNDLKYDLTNVADLKSYSDFLSKNTRGQ
jgi:hypothetical protein